MRATGTALEAPPARSRRKQRKGSPSPLSHMRATCATCSSQQKCVVPLPGNKEGHTDNDTTACQEFSREPKQRAIRALSCA